MKRNLFFMALSAMALVTSCSNDEVTEISDSNAIKFDVTAGNITRAANVFCNNNKPNDFQVWASFDNKTYINGDQIHNNGSAWVNQSGMRYWPETDATKKVNFFAEVGADDEFNWNNGFPKIENFTVGTVVSGQKDLLYATKIAQAKPSDGKVVLNFRHALSQIVFQAKNTNPNLYVEIEGVSICKVGNTGTYTYNTTTSTDSNTQGHNDDATYDNTGRGSWNNTVAGIETYAVDFTAVEIPGGVKETLTGSTTEVDKIYSLTSANDENKEFSSNALLLLPQTTTAWIPTEGTSAANSTGTYFLVKCKICNYVEEGEGDNKTINKVYLWGNENEAKEAAIPVNLNWQEGYKYIYTFKFGEGNGGVDPEDPKPVLLPITFDITVDDFVLANESDVDMNGTIKSEEENNTEE